MRIIMVEMGTSMNITEKNEDEMWDEMWDIVWAFGIVVGLHWTRGI